MNFAASIYHVIKDPVHGTMQFSTQENNWIKPFIDHAVFQRLRHIKQLGLNDIIFPGAVHTRFNHSLGCCYIATQIANKIGLSLKEKQCVMLAGLLHDIGHGPFSHSFEGIFLNKSILHEDWTPYFLNEFQQAEFLTAYAQRNPQFPLNEEIFTRIQQLITHQHPPSILQDIVSSQLDADRLDYLLRDSHFCGVKYGEFDFRWMLHCLTQIPTEDGLRLGISHKGIGVVEHYLMARRLMTRNIYYLNKSLSISFYLVELLKHAVQWQEAEKLCRTELWEFLEAASVFNRSSTTEKKLFLQDNYAIYKELSDNDIQHFIKLLSKQSGDHPAILLAKRLQSRTFAKMVPVDTQHVLVIKQELEAFKQSHPHLQSWQFTLIETPHQYYNSKTDVIWVLDEHQRVQTLHHRSPIIHALAHQTEQVNYICIDRLIYSEPSIQTWLSQMLEVMHGTDFLHS